MVYGDLYKQYEVFSDETLKELETGRLSKDSYQSGNVTERELIIVKMRFGIDMPNEEGWTLSAIGKLFGISKERVRQIEARGMRKMRNNPEMQKLKHLVTGDK
jgi:DNA-directed RNA polymerase sigma subunit (sigma70/sigma32)